MIDPQKVAIYIRWSTEDQSEGTTLAVQQETCLLYARSQGWDVADEHIYVDDGYSGGTLDRPALTRLRQAVRDGQVGCVVVYKLDRLSRSVVDTVNLVLEEWDDRCHLRSAREPVDTSSPAGKMFFYTLVSYAEWERSVIRERTASGRLRRAQEGRWAGGKAPFGYRITPEKRLAVEPDEAALVSRIYREYLGGASAAAIAHKLNDEGHRFGENPFSASAVRRMLINPIYAGRLTYGRTQVNPRYRRRPGESRNLNTAKPAVDLEDGAPAIIPIGDWEQVQSLRVERRPGTGDRPGPRSLASRYLLTGVTRCSHCGSALVGVTQGARSAYYCRGHKERGASYCSGGLIAAEQLEEAVINALPKVYQHAEVHLRRRLRELLSRSLSEVDSQIAGAVREQDRLRREGARLERLLRRGELTGAEYRQVRLTMDGEVERLHAQLHRLSHRRNCLQQAIWPKGRPSALPAFTDLPRSAQKQILRCLVDQVTAFKPKGSNQATVRVRWRVAANV